MPHRLVTTAALACGVLLGAAFAPSRAGAEALLLVEADTGKVLHASNATQPWYPASVSKLMTAYVTLRAVKEGRIALDTLVAVSENALAQQPSKMGFPVGTRMTVDNALKMMLVKSANDMAVVLAEGVAGSVEAFSSEMNKASVRLGMTQSNWVNPNGLPDEMQVTSARDMAILARALIREMPEYDHYWHISAIKFGRRVMRNYNKLIDRYPGADGMKTGFICASGYNLVASATRNGKRLIAVVLGASSGKERTEVAAGMLERGFNGGALAWLTPSLGTVESLKTIAAEPPNLREEICGRNRKARTDHAEEEENQPQANSDGDSASAFASVLPGAQAIDRASLIGPLQPSEPPTVVNVIAPPGAPADPDRLVAGPKKKKLAVGKGRNGRKTAVINVSKPAAGEKKTSAASAKQKPAAHKPAPKQAAHPAKPAAPAPKQAAHAPKPAGAKSAAHDDRPRGLAAPAKPKPAAQKPAAQKPAAQKPAAKPKSGERSASAQ